jgi:hypothetical protein
MAGARVSIDALPSLATPGAGTLVPVQDGGVTKKLLVSVLSDTLAAALTAHLNDTVDAHDATAISTTVSGTGVTSTTVQGQLGEIATLLANRVINGGGAASIVVLTQAAYDALTPKVATTLYFING